MSQKRTIGPLPGAPTLRIACRAMAWSCVSALAYLSLVPPGGKVDAGIPGQLGHAIAYFVAGASLALVCPSRVRPILFLAAYGGALELLQNLVPGRDPKLIDALASAVGGLVGVLTAAWAVRLVRAREP